MKSMAKLRESVATRGGFTLVELFVVLGIIAILFALAAAGVQKAWAAADRTQCASNLRQIGIALHQHHDRDKAFPAGIKSRLTSQKFPAMSWLTQLLPFIEQEQLWKATINAYEHQRLPFYEAPHIAFNIPIPLFACASDPRLNEAQLTHRALRMALTSYVGVLGTDYMKTDGFLFLDSRVRLESIRDGTSNTLAVAERPPSPDNWYGWWYAGFGQAGTGSADMLLGVREGNFGGEFVMTCGKGPFHFAPGALQQQCDLFHFWSLHAGGANFLFADGTVRFLGYEADVILPALGTRESYDGFHFPD